LDKHKLRYAVIPASPESITAGLAVATRRISPYRLGSWIPGSPASRFCRLASAPEWGRG